MHTTEEILAKYDEFNSYLDEIDVESLKDTHLRSELKAFKQKLDDVRLRSLSYDLSKVLEEMRVEEHPEILQVHRFPELKEIDFLSEEMKIKLDSFLANFKPSNYVYGLFRVDKGFKQSDIKKIFAFLEEKGIVESVYFALCQHCSDGRISTGLSLNEKEALEQLFREKRTSYSFETYEEILEYLPYTCMDCESETDFDTIRNVTYKHSYQMKAKPIIIT